MLKKHRLPFIILGIGIGIIVTSAIYTFNPIVKYKDYSKEEIINKATDLGMVFLKDNIEAPTKTYENKTDNSLKEEEKEQKTIQFAVKYGDSLTKVSKGLCELGVIDDEEEFIEFVKDIKADKKLRVGNYVFLPDLDYEAIIKILTTPSP